MNIWSSLHPCAITLSPSSMKHLSWLNHTCIPWSTICPTNTKFLVIVGTCKTFFIHTLLPMWLRGMFSMCLIVWTVLPPVSTNLGCLGVFKLVNYSSWFVIWLEAPESTNNTSHCIDVLASIELAWCFMKNMGHLSIIKFSCHDEKITSTKLYELIHIFVNGCLTKW